MVSALSQPMVEGAKIKSNLYFLDGPQLITVLPNGDLEKVKAPAEIGKVLSLHSPPNWKDRLLLVGETGLALVTAGEPKLLTPESEKTGEFKVLGDHLLWHRSDSQVVEVISPEQVVTSLEIEGLVHGPYLLGVDRFAVLSKGGRGKIFKLTDLDHPEEFELPFPLDGMEITTNPSGLLLWRKDSDKALLVGQRVVPTYGPLSRGVKPLGDKGFLLAATSQLYSLSNSGGLRNLPSPNILTEENFPLARFLQVRNDILFLGKDKDSLVSIGFTSDGRAPGGILGKENVLALIVPDPGHSSAPFLLTETELTEAKVDDEGEAVLDLETNKVETHVVKGHKLYFLNSRGQWDPLANQPRSRVVGPAGLVGNTLVYATQTEPPHQVGVERDLHHRFRYPKVVLQAYQASIASPLWTLDLPRGEAPSLARLPEGGDWPLLGENGPLLFTTEDARLAALDLREGKINWTTEPLPLDDSRPGMLHWEDSFALVAVENTTREFLLFNEEGELLHSKMLNDIFNGERTWNLIGVVVICLALLIYIYLAGKKKLFIRRIAGLEALEEAVGRATEMGKPVLYVTGLADVDDIQTLAALSILSHVAKKTAEYDTPILATTSRAVTFSAAQEVVRDAFTMAGRPDSFSVESVRYISDDQFGYAAGVDGLMLREEPAANFYMGKFYAESLIFAETGNATGAIQIAGTAQANQLPFFVAACDYTLIGEELFAASAYLSGDPMQVGSLRGQDVGKAIVMVVLVVLSIDATAGSYLANAILNIFGGSGS